MKIIINFFSSVFQLSRAWEYYGSIVFVTCVGLALSNVERPSLIFVALIANLLAVAFSFMFNDIEDAEDDILDPHKAKRNPITASLIKPKAAYVVCLLTAAVSIILYAFLGLLPFIFGLASIILSFCYSWKPVRLKSKPIIDVLAHGLQLGTLQFLSAASIKLLPLFSAAWLSFLIFALSAIADINNEVRDYKTDQAVGLRNTLSIINLRSWGHYVPFFWLGPVSIILLFMLSKISTIGQIFSLIVAIVAIGVYITSSSHNRKEVFFYTRSQQLGTIWGVVFILCR